MAAQKCAPFGMTSPYFRSVWSEFDKNAVPAFAGAAFFMRRGLNPSGSEWSAGGAPEPRGGLPRRAGQLPPSPPNKAADIDRKSTAFFTCKNPLISRGFQSFKT